MKRKILTLLLIAVVILLLVSVLLLKRSKAGKSVLERERCNIILIIADALRKDVLGCYGGEARTPNIDRLAAAGVVFENAYSTAPCTLPSSVSMLTGNFSRAYGVISKDDKYKTVQYTYYVNDDETLPAEALKKAGWKVLMDIENPMAARSNNVQGFHKTRSKGQMTPEEINFVEENIDITDIETDQYPLAAKKYYWRMYDLLYYLLTVPPEENFYILKWFLDPHAPYDPAEKFKGNITVDPARLPEKPGFYTESLVKELRKVNEERPLTEYELHYLRTLYKSEVESIDERVGYIIEALENRRLLDKTVIIFTSDHGELFGEHGAVAHGEYFYEPLVNIPLIISGPGIAKGKREKSLVSHLDLMPTIKDLAGVNYLDNMKGKSYKPMLQDEPRQDRVLYLDRISSDITRNPEADALIMNGYKLIINKKGDNYVPELYNIREDPGETRDISNENKPLLSEMFKKILEFRKDNQLRLKQNAAKIGKDINLEKETQKTREQLKSLGYL